MSEAVVQAPSWRIDSWYPDLDPKIQQKLKIYWDELSRANRTMTLIPVKTIPFADAIHFADSIIASRLIYSHDPKMTELYDLASGNGFPGLVFAILYPQVKVVLVDTSERSCDFFKSVVAQCQLTNVEIKKTTIDQMPANSMKHCVTRGLASISKVILMVRKLVPIGGEVFHLKGETWPAEVGEIPTQLCSAWTPALVGEYKLPIGTMKFGVVKTTRIGS